MDIVLFPSCDLHVALHGTPPLFLDVYSRELKAGNMSYELKKVTDDCSFDFFAPYNKPGERLKKFVNIDPLSGAVVPYDLGINLVQIRWKKHYIIARIQVHERILGWWFGNTSVTTAKDVNFAHAQPSIYSLFSDDPSGTDLVGDITGHGYVTLTSSNNAVMTVNTDGRLQGLQEGKVTLSGNFLGVSHTLPVKVVDYGKTRPILEYVQIPNIDHPEDMHNILFIPEGFRNTDTDREKFDKIVTEVVDEIFSKPRHSPFNLLEGSFNVWKAYQPSEQHAVTCGFRVNDEPTPNLLGKGYPIPYGYRIESSDKSVYTVELLTRIVGLPLRNENRNPAELKKLWKSQSLKRFDPNSKKWVDSFDPDKVNDDLIAVWKNQKSLGILEARDTFFGLHLGARFGDRLSSVSIDPASGNASLVLPPTQDKPVDANLFPFIKRVYEWFTLRNPSRMLTPDPRRHPPELQADNRDRDNFGNSILKYIAGLRGQFPPHPNVGQEWIPDPTGTNFKKSRGLIALITNDGLIGGTNFNRLTITANTLARHTALGFEYTNSGNERIMKRTPPDSISENIDDIINTVAHEFGHSFNLGDEYESFAGDRPDSNDRYDNIANLKTIQLDPNYLNNRKLDPDQVKWFELLRIRLSDTLTKDSTTESGQIKVSIDKRFIGRWIEAKNQNLEAYLRRIEITPEGKQLPFKVGDDHYLIRLTIGDINQTNGTILLGGNQLPPAPLPVFPKGSLLFIPKQDDAKQIMHVVEKEVLKKLHSTNLPLNLDTDTKKVNDWADYPVDIDDFKRPCKSYKLIGVYEGAGHYTGMVYRPSGLCKMRSQSDPSFLHEWFTEEVGDGEFCHVCKYLIVNRVDPSKHALLDEYYPKAKKNE